MIHPDMPNVPKVEIRKKLATANKVKEDCVVVFGLKTKYGGGKSTGFALIYDSMDNRKKYDSRKNLLRVIIDFFSYLILYIRRNSSTRELRVQSNLRKSRAESRRSEVLPKPRLPPPERRRSDPPS